MDEKTAAESEKFQNKAKPFPIVAIGASAGGLEAITELLSNLPAGTGTGTGLGGITETEGGSGGLRHLGDEGLERLVGVLGEVLVELADLGGLGDEGLVGGLGVVGLHFDRLVERADAGKLLEERTALFERLLGIIRVSGRDRLQAFRVGPRGRNSGIELLFAVILEFLNLQHRDSFFPGCEQMRSAFARWPDVRPPIHVDQYSALHKYVKDSCAMHNVNLA